MPLSNSNNPMTPSAQHGEPLDSAKTFDPWLSHPEELQKVLTECLNDLQRPQPSVDPAFITSVINSLICKTIENFMNYNNIGECRCDH